jgi:xanthine dehydrogenase accessory factor
MRDLYARLDRLQRQGHDVVVCTVVRTRGSVPRHVGARMVVHADGSLEGTVGGGELEERVRQQALEVLEQRKPRVVEHGLQDAAAGDAGVCGGTVEVYLEPLTQRPTLLVIGAGHVGRALVHLGHWLGFHVVVSDDRPTHCTPEAVPGADEYRAVPIGELTRTLRIHRDTWIVMPTRGMPLDVEGLPFLLDAPFGYLGVIGSRRRWAAVRKQLLERGVRDEQLDRVHAPMGLELEAETPEEIAVSVLAEILMLRNGGTGRSMKWPGVQADDDSDTMPA